MKLVSSSQAGQDIFAYEVTGRRKDGTFLDIGAYNLCQSNNSYALERIGWKGLLVDVYKDAERIPKRTSPFVQADATKLDWIATLETAGIGPRITYGSFDIDDATPDLVDVFPFDKITLDVLTVEHDLYRLGTGPKRRIEEKLCGEGYCIICEDVKLCIEGYMDGPFETWFAHPSVAGSARRFSSYRKYWNEILKDVM